MDFVCGISIVGWSGLSLSQAVTDEKDLLSSGNGTAAFCWNDRQKSKGGSRSFDSAPFGHFAQDDSILFI